VSATDAKPVPKHLEAALDAIQLAMAKGQLPQAAVMAELGISGTTNWRGDLQVESNAKLIYQLAYGQAGSRTWGEWERLIRTDPDVSRALEFTAAQLRDARVDVVEAPEDMMKDRALSKAQADFVRWNLLEALEPGWSDVIQQMTRGPLGYGFSIHEEVMAQCQHILLPGGSGYKLAKLAQRLPVTIEPNGWLEENGELKTIQQQGEKDGQWARVSLPANQVVLISWNRDGNNYLGFSAFRSVWYICRIREQMLRAINVGTMREACGIPIATMDKDVVLTEAQRGELFKLLANNVFNEHAACVMPAGVSMEWVYSPAANKGHVIELWEKLGLAVLGQLQAQQVALGTSNTGSRAVGEVHDSVANAFAEGVVANIEAAINGVGNRPYTGLLRKLVMANWGPQQAYPKLKLTLKQAKLSAQDFATAGKTMRDGKLITVWRLEDENGAREKLGMSSITEDEWDEAQAKSEAAAAALAKSLEQSQTQPPKPGEQSQTKSPKPGAQDEAKKFSLWAPRREVRDSEKPVAFAAIASFLDDARDNFERGARPLVVELLAKAMPDIREAMKDGNPDEVATLSLDTKRLEAFIGDFISRARAEGFRQLKAEKKRGQAGRGELRTEPVKLASEEERDDEVAQSEIDQHVAENDKVLEAKRKKLLRDMERRLRRDIESEAIDVVRTGGQVDEVASNVIADQLDTGAFRGDAGSVLMTAFNMGRDDFMAEYGDEVEGVELSSLLDENTCEHCDSMDGEEFDFGSAGYEENTPPLRECDGGNKCRCLYTVQWK
jgi:hypothetical protein